MVDHGLARRHTTKRFGGAWRSNDGLLSFWRVATAFPAQLRTGNSEFLQMSAYVMLTACCSARFPVVAIPTTLRRPGDELPPAIASAIRSFRGCTPIHLELPWLSSSSSSLACADGKAMAASNEEAIRHGHEIQSFADSRRAPKAWFSSMPELAIGIYVDRNPSRSCRSSFDIRGLRSLSRRARSNPETGA